MKVRINHRKTHLNMLSMIIVAAFVVAISACGSSSKSEQAITDPSTIPASFSVNHIVDRTTNPLTDKESAGAIFFEGLLTIAFQGGKVEIVDPQEAVTPLNLLYNTLGAPYYSVDLTTPLETDQPYVFRVTLANGTAIENRVNTPTHDLQITAPVSGGPVSKSAQTTVSWTGATGTGNVSIIVSPNSPDTGISNIFHLGGISVLDSGTANLNPGNLQAVNPGQNVLTIVRSKIVHANGFAPNSTIGAFFVYSEPVNVTE
jgi:hypothetical protein